MIFFFRKILYNWQILVTQQAVFIHVKMQHIQTLPSIHYLMLIHQTFSIINITNICYKQICSHTSICNHTHMYSGIYNHVYNPTLDKLEQSLYNNLQLLKKEKPKEIIFYSSSLRDLCERKTY